MSLSDAVKAYYDAQEKAYQQALVNRRTIHLELLSLGVITVTAEYNGCGDSGQIERVHFEGGTDQVEAHLITLFDPPSQEYPEGKGQELTLSAAVEHLFYVLLEREHDGWEINEGGYGEFVWNVQTNQIYLTHNEAFTDYTTTEHEF